MGLGDFFNKLIGKTVPPQAVQEPVKQVSEQPEIINPNLPPSQQPGASTAQPLTQPQSDNLTTQVPPPLGAEIPQPSPEVPETQPIENPPTPPPTVQPAVQNPSTQSDLPSS